MKKNRILFPVDYENFAADYWESQPLHIERSDSQYFEGLLSEASIIKFIEEGAASFPDVQVINARQAVPVADYTIDKKAVSPDKIMQCFSQGATIIVSQAHKKFLPLAELCEQFCRDFQIRCQTNAYLSPAGNQGFHSHYDTHDVFVLQVAGRKRFRFYTSEIELPFTDDTYTPENNTSSEIVDEVELSAGDTLYIPRGIVHDAIADDGESSLHITLGAFPFVLRDLMQEMAQVAAEQNIALRRSASTRVTTQEFTAVKALYESIFTESNYADALSRLADEVAIECVSSSDAVSGFDNESGIDPQIGSGVDHGITRESVIEFRHQLIVSVENRPGRLKVRMPGQVICFEEPLSSAVAAIVGARRIVVGEIPGISDQQQLALCKQLAEADAIAVSTKPAV